MAFLRVTRAPCKTPPVPWSRNLGDLAVADAENLGAGAACTIRFTRYGGSG